MPRPATPGARAADPAAGDRVPPQDLEAEMSLLGAMLLDSDREQIGTVIQVIPRDESSRFYRPDHRILFETIVDVSDAGKPIDIIVIEDELRRRGQLEAIGGRDYLIDLVDSVPSVSNVEYYAHIVREKSMLRDLIGCAREMVLAAYDQSDPAANILDDAERHLFAVTEQRIAKQAISIRQCLEEAQKLLESHGGNMITGVPTGFTELDELLGGLQQGDFIVIAARPSMGKTALGLSMLEYIGIVENTPSVFFSLEMSRQQIAHRMLCSHTQIDMHKLRRGRLKHVMEQIVADLRGGKTLDEALGQRKGALPPLFAAAVTAGVRTGRLPEVLATLNSHARTMADLRTMVAGALYYPLILMLLGLGLFLFVALAVAPMFQVVFDDFRIPMPAITRIALLLCSRPFLYVVGPIVWIVGGGFFFWFFTRWTPVGRRLFNRLAYSLPLWGVLLRSVRMASFSELLALLIEYEVPLPEASSLAGRSTTDPGLAQACAEVEQELRQGESFSVALDRQRAVPAMFTWMVAVGEPRGMLTGSLRQLGEIYRRRTVLRANLLRSVLPPFLVVVVGLGVVGFFVLGFLLPLITLITELA